MNREQIEALKEGDTVERSYLGKGHFTPVIVSRIYGRGVDVMGRAYVLLYTKRSPDATSEMSICVSEGDSRFIRIPAKG
jgi:hypothetical protein